MSWLPVKPMSPQTSSSPVQHTITMKRPIAGNISSPKSTASPHCNLHRYLTLFSWLLILSLDGKHKAQVGGTGSRFCTMSNPSVLGPGPTAGPKTGSDLGKKLRLPFNEMKYTLSIRPIHFQGRVQRPQPVCPLLQTCSSPGQTIGIISLERNPPSTNNYYPSECVAKTFLSTLRHQLIMLTYFITSSQWPTGDVRPETATDRTMNTMVIVSRFFSNSPKLKSNNTPGTCNPRMESLTAAGRYRIFSRCHSVSDIFFLVLPNGHRVLR